MSGENKDIMNTELKKEDMPYEKFLKYGPESLTDAELLAIIIRTGTKEDDPVTIGYQLLNMVGNCWGLAMLHHYSVKDFMTIKGIGEVKAVKLKCIGEISKRISRQDIDKGIPFINPEMVADYYMEELRHLEKERIVLVMLDNKNRFLSDEVISEGTINTTIFSPREIFIKALHEGAVNIMLIHNHPSGDPTPSKADCITTQRVKEVADLIDIHLIDHIVIGDRRYISFREKGLL